ncbi:hypothetical protein ACFVWX_13530 [Streptomyces sp. NPDC058220]|uniref:hypothetical protein n=1 Tax=Streptomyces sp. NPDC058220 TaxID=3346387 RepID=UPI0036E03C58
MTDQPEPYTYTDPSDDTLTIGRTNNVVSLKAEQGDKVTDIHVLTEDAERVVAAIRTAAGQPEPDRATVLVEAADFLRDAHFRDGLSVQEIGTALRRMADEAQQPTAGGRPVVPPGCQPQDCCGDPTAHPTDVRRARYAVAIDAASGWVLDGGQHMVDAVLAVADGEIADSHAALRRGNSRLADENARLRAELEQARASEAHPAEHTWAAELYDPLADEWVPSTRYIDRDRAVNHLAHASAVGPTWKDGTPTRRRLVRATTTYTVEPSVSAVPAAPETEA